MVEEAFVDDWEALANTGPILEVEFFDTDPELLVELVPSKTRGKAVASGASASVDELAPATAPPIDRFLCVVAPKLFDELAAGTTSGDAVASTVAASAKLAPATAGLTD